MVKINNTYVCDSYLVKNDLMGHCSYLDKTVEPRECRACLKNTEPKFWPPPLNLLQSLKLGTKIKRVTNAINIPTCGGCQARAMKLNGD